MADNAARTGVLPVRELKATPSGPVEGICLPGPGGQQAAPFEASRWGLDPGERTSWDQHQVLEVWLVAAGAGSVWRGEEQTPVGPGDVVLMPSQVRHRLHNTGTSRMSLFSIWWPPAAGPVPDA